MSDAELQTRAEEIVVDEVFPHAPETIWRTLTSGKLMGRWLGMEPVGFEAVVGNRFTYRTTPAGGMGRHDPVRGSARDPERTFRALLEGRTRRQCRLWSAARHRGHLHAEEGRRRHAAAPRAFGIRPAQERYGVPEHERRLEQGRFTHWRDHRRARLKLTALTRGCLESRSNDHAT